MGAKTDYQVTQVLNHLRGQAYSVPAAVYLALFKTDPTHTGTAGTEISNVDYVRRAITFGAPNGGKVSNTLAVTYPVPTVAWDEAAYFGIMDAATNGNMLYYGVLSAPRKVKAGDTPITIGIGGITIEEE